eukprot:271485_1
MTAEINAEAKQSNDNESKPTRKKPLEFDVAFYLQYDENTVDVAIQRYLKNKEHKKYYPKPFIDHELMLHEEKENFWHLKHVPYANDDESKAELCDCSTGVISKTRKKYGITKNFRQRFSRALFAISTPVIFLIIATYLEVELNVMIGMKKKKIF